MDFQITCSSEYPSGALTFTKNTDLRTDVFMSIFTKKGSFFQRPDFGSNLFKINKLSDSTINLARQYIADALQWLIIVGKATAVEVVVEKDLQNLGQMDIKVNVTQANGVIITYQMFKLVGDSAAAETYATSIN